MDIVIKTGFQKITHSIPFTNEIKNNGRDWAIASHVKRVEEFAGVAGYKVIRCSVIRSTSVTQSPYLVQMEVSK